MKKERLNIEGIPAVLWGDGSEKLLVAVHGNLSHKEDVPLAILAEEAVLAGYRVLSFDLPQHGDRKNDPTLCKVQNCVAELRTIMAYARGHASEIGIFACSMGAYFSLLAYAEEPLEHALLLSPVVDMGRIIGNMMQWFDISEDRLRTEQEIPTPVGQTLYWDYYRYVQEHPVDRWAVPTSILYGSADDLCAYDTVAAFTQRFDCSLDIADGSGHYFHTDSDLVHFGHWLQNSLSKGSARIG